jgi:hypothetical protein
MFSFVPKSADAGPRPFAQSFGSPCTLNTSSRCGLIGRLSRTPEGSGLRNHFAQMATISRLPASL